MHIIYIKYAFVSKMEPKQIFKNTVKIRMHTEDMEKKASGPQMTKILH